MPRLDYLRSDPANIKLRANKAAEIVFGFIGVSKEDKFGSLF